MKNFGDFETWLYSEQIFKIFPSLFVHDIPREEDLQKGNLPLINNENQVFLFVKSYDLDIQCVFRRYYPFLYVPNCSVGIMDL